MEDRRQFFKKLFVFLGFGVAALKSGVVYAKKLAVGLDKIPSLKKTGGSATVKLAGQDILLIRSAESEIHGVSAKCTHMNCPIKYNAKTKTIDCSCHGSAFALSGKVLKGPATKDLKAYPASLKDGRVIISVD